MPVGRLKTECSQTVSRRDISLGDVWFSFIKFSVVSMEKWPAAVGDVGISVARDGDFMEVTAGDMTLGDEHEERRLGRQRGS